MNFNSLSEALSEAGNPYLTAALMLRVQMIEASGEASIVNAGFVLYTPDGDRYCCPVIWKGYTPLLDRSWASHMENLDYAEVIMTFDAGFYLYTQDSQGVHFGFFPLPVHSEEGQPHQDDTRS